MKFKKLFVVAICFVQSILSAGQQPSVKNGLTIQVADSPTQILQKDLDAHKKLAVAVFYTYDVTISSPGPLDTYYQYFDAFFGHDLEWAGAFQKQENGEFIIGAYDQSGTLVGGVYGKKLFGPIAALNLKDGESVYYMGCIYVATDHQNQGIGTFLTEAFTTYAAGKSIFLYTYTINRSARRVYEKAGFTLIIDSLHQDGCATSAVCELLDWHLYEPKDFVAYRKN